MKQKKEGKKQEEYDLSSNDDKSESSESDNEAFIISKKKSKKTPPPKQTLKPRDRAFDDKSIALKNELDELRNIVTDIALMQKKQHKVTKKQTNRPSGGTKIVVLPQAQTSNSSGPSDSVMDALRRSLM